MGKNFGGGNQKAIEAKAKKTAAKEQEAEKRRRREEEAAWQDNNKEILAKEKRRLEKEEKAKKQQEAKALKKSLEAEEAEELSRIASDPAPQKLTRAQIEQKRAAYKKPTKLAPGLEFLEENPNKQKAARLAEGHIDASSIDEALDQMSMGTEVVDRNPEKRMKAAFEAFCERETPLMKSENPFLKRSQLKEALWKKWQKSPENPLNQAAAAGVGKR